MRSKRAHRVVLLAISILTPLTLGASCSTNAVAQAAATTFFNALASAVAGALADALAPAAE